MPEEATDDPTVDAFVKLFFTNFQMESKDQLKKMLYATDCFCNCFKNTVKERKDLHDMNLDPVTYIWKKDKKYFNPKQFLRLMRGKQKIGRLEWIFWKDTKKNAKLRKEYHKDENTPRRRTFFTLGEIIDIRDFIFKETAQIFAEVARKNSVRINPLYLPDLANLEVRQVGVEDYEQ